MKELKINIPEGYEIDQEKSTFECIKFKPKNLTYKDICKSLFKGKGVYFIHSRGEIKKQSSEHVAENVIYDPNNCTSENQAKKLLAINKLMNVAKYLNGDWKPDLSSRSEQKFYIILEKGDIFTSQTCTVVSGNVYFKSKELAEQAIEILGEDTIKLALSTDW